MFETGSRNGFLCASDALGFQGRVRCSISTQQGTEALQKRKQAHQLLRGCLLNRQQPAPSQATHSCQNSVKCCVHTKDSRRSNWQHCDASRSQALHGLCRAGICRRALAFGGFRQGLLASHSFFIGLGVNMNHSPVGSHWRRQFDNVIVVRIDRHLCRGFDHPCAFSCAFSRTERGWSTHLALASISARRHRGEIGS